MAGDHQEVIDKITLLLKDSNIRKQVGETAYVFAKNEFSWEKIAERFTEILDSFGIKSRLDI
mgnify:CR=1 FL=1